LYIIMVEVFKILWGDEISFTTSLREKYYNNDKYCYRQGII